MAQDPLLAVWQAFDPTTLECSASTKGAIGHTLGSFGILPRSNAGLIVADGDFAAESTLTAMLCTDGSVRLLC
jgi:hypothetical protein